MRSVRLFTPQPLSADSTVELDPSSAAHLARVLRAQVGDRITLFNGSGLDWAGQVTELSKRRVLVSLDQSSVVETESTLHVELGLCLSKGERFDWAIQKATEMGVAGITPLFSARVDVKIPKERLSKRVQHWQGVVRSACEQCGRARVPDVSEPLAVSQWLSGVEAETKLILHHRQSGHLPDTKPSRVALLVGPEGGFNEEEVASALASGFAGLKLGPRVMRTETAPIAALAVIGARWGDLQ